MSEAYGRYSTEIITTNRRAIDNQRHSVSIAEQVTTAHCFGVFLQSRYMLIINLSSNKSTLTVP